MTNIKFYKQQNIPIEMHRARIVQTLSLIPIEERLKCLVAAGNNTFLLSNKDIFLDLLTDSGINAMSDNMQAAMLVADDSYAGSRTYDRMKEKIQYIFGMKYFLPTHQGRASENILVKCFVKPGDIVPMNVRFDSIKGFIKDAGANFIELISDSAYEIQSDNMFKGNIDINKLNELLKVTPKEKIPFLRIEAGANLIGGQPVSLENIEKVSRICKKYKILLVMDASLLQDNLYFIK